MGKPAGPGEMYCTSCGELINRDAKYCTYCGARNRHRESPTDRAGPATATDDREFGPIGSDDRDGDSRVDSADERVDRTGDRAHADRRRKHGEPPQEGTRTHRQPRVGAESVGIAPNLDERPLRTVGIALGIGILGIVLLVVVSLIVGLAAFGLPVSELAVIAIATGIGQYVGFAGLAVWYLRRRGFEWDRVWSYLGVRMPTLRDIGVVVLGYAVIFGMLIVLGIVVEVFLPEPAENEGAQALAELDSTTVYVAAVLFMFLVVGPCEEFLYRGIVQNRLRERLSAAPSIAIASLIFAAVHVVALAGDPASMLVTVGILFVPSLVLGAVYEYTGNIVVPSLLHGLHNSIIVTILFFGPELEEGAQTIVGLLASLSL